MDAALRKSPWRSVDPFRWKRGYFRLSVAYDIAVAAASVPITIRLLDLNKTSVLNGNSSVIFLSVLLFIFISINSFSLFGMQTGFWRHTAASELFTVVKAVTCAVLAFAVVLLLMAVLVAGSAEIGSEPPRLPRTALAVQWCVLISLLCGARLAFAATTASRLKKRGLVRYTDWEPVILVGANEMAALLIQLLSRLGGSRFEVVGLVEGYPDLVGRTIHGVPVLGTVADLPQVVARLSMHGVVPRRVVLSTPADRYGRETLQQLGRAAGQANLPILAGGDFIQLVTAESPGLTRTSSATHRKVGPATRPLSIFPVVKRAIDVLGAVLLIAAFAPFLLLVAVVVRGTLGAPVIFRQVRLGRDFRPFSVYKFRTLKDSLTPDGRVLHDRDRRTLVGSALRRTRLDELPQLLNVLAGDMSLIGPRPLLAHELPDISQIAHPRFSVRPGITGWAQVNGGRLLTTRQKFALDLWYVRHSSPWIDFVIVCKTVAMVILGRDTDEAAVRQPRR